MGSGPDLAIDALGRARNVADEVGFKLVVQDVIDDGGNEAFARRMEVYRRLGFQSFQDRPERMFITIDTIRAMFRLTSMDIGPVLRGTLAWAGSASDKGTASCAWFMLYAHDDNPEIAEQRAAWTKRFHNATMVPMLPASDVVRVGEPEAHADSAEWMRRLRSPLCRLDRGAPRASGPLVAWRTQRRHAYHERAAPTNPIATPGKRDEEEPAHRAPLRRNDGDQGNCRQSCRHRVRARRDAGHHLFQGAIIQIRQGASRRGQRIPGRNRPGARRNSRRRRRSRASRRRGALAWLWDVWGREETERISSIHQRCEHVRRPRADIGCLRCRHSLWKETSIRSDGNRTRACAATYRCGFRGAYAPHRSGAMPPCRPSTAKSSPSRIDPYDAPDPLTVRALVRPVLRVVLVNPTPLIAAGQSEPRGLGHAWRVVRPGVDLL